MTKEEINKKLDNILDNYESGSWRDNKGNYGTGYEELDVINMLKEAYELGQSSKFTYAKITEMKDNPYNIDYARQTKLFEE